MIFRRFFNSHVDLSKKLDREKWLMDLNLTLDDIIGAINKAGPVTLTSGNSGIIIDNTDPLNPIITLSPVFAATMDWANTVNMKSPDITSASIITLQGANGGLSVNQLFNFPPHNVQFVAQNGYQFTFIGTAFADISSSGQFLWNGDIVINGNMKDSLTLATVSITNTNGTFTVLKEVSRSIYG